MKDTSDGRVWRAWTAGTIFLATLMPCAIGREVIFTLWPIVEQK
jgi:hypothetical protein